MRPLKILLLALTLSAIYNWHSIANAVNSLSAPARADVPPGNYAWTPEHGLQPLSAGSPATPLPH